MVGIQTVSVTISSEVSNPRQWCRGFYFSHYDYSSVGTRGEGGYAGSITAPTAGRGCSFSPVSVHTRVGAPMAQASSRVQPAQ